MTSDYAKGIRKGEKENLALNKLLADKTLEGQMKSTLLKNLFEGEKEEIAIRWIGQGIRGDKALKIVQLFMIR